MIALTSCIRSVRVISDGSNSEPVICRLPFSRFVFQ